jgi:hypothetical protein
VRTTSVARTVGVVWSNDGTTPNAL